MVKNETWWIFNRRLPCISKLFMALVISSRYNSYIKHFMSWLLAWIWNWLTETESCFHLLATQWPHFSVKWVTRVSPATQCHQLAVLESSAKKPSTDSRGELITLSPSTDGPTSLRYMMRTACTDVAYAVLVLWLNRRLWFLLLTIWSLSRGLKFVSKN